VAGSASPIIMMTMQQSASEARDSKALWATCPDCGHEFGIPAQRVFWFIDFLLTRAENRVKEIKRTRFTRSGRRPMTPEGEA
jgi:hypothetical protein